MTQFRNGKWKEFNKHAVLVSEGVYENNEKHGVWREFYDYTGTLMIEESYDKGVPHGRYASYHPSGALWSEGNFNRGRRDGYFYIYNEQGKLVRRLLFVNDIQIEDTNF